MLTWKSHQLSDWEILNIVRKQVVLADYGELGIPYEVRAAEWSQAAEWKICSRIVLQTDSQPGEKAHRYQDYQDQRSFQKSNANLFAQPIYLSWTTGHLLWGWKTACRSSCQLNIKCNFRLLLFARYSTSWAILVLTSRNHCQPPHGSHFDVFSLPYVLFISGNHAIGTVRKFPTLPLNGGGAVGAGGSNSTAAAGQSGHGLWIDPTSGVWRQAAGGGNPGGVGSCTTKEQLPGYAQATAQQGQQPTLLPDYERWVSDCLSAQEVALISCPRLADCLITIKNCANIGKGM